MVDLHLLKGLGLGFPVFSYLQTFPFAYVLQACKFLLLLICCEFVLQRFSGSCKHLEKFSFFLRVGKLFSRPHQSPLPVLLFRLSGFIRGVLGIVLYLQLAPAFHSSHADWVLKRKRPVASIRIHAHVRNSFRGFLSLGFQGFSQAWLRWHFCKLPFCCVQENRGSRWGPLLFPSVGISGFDMHAAFTPLVDVGNIPYNWLSWRGSKTLLSMLNCCY